MARILVAGDPDGIASRTLLERLVETLRADGHDAALSTTADDPAAEAREADAVVAILDARPEPGTAALIAFAHAQRKPVLGCIAAGATLPRFLRAMCTQVAEVRRASELPRHLEAFYARVRPFAGRLVRDEVPELVKQAGHHVTFRRLAPEDLPRFLKRKIAEEAHSLDEAAGGHEKEELADLLEALEAFIAARGMDKDELRRIKAHKRERRGGFERGFVVEMAVTTHADGDTTPDEGAAPEPPPRPNHPSAPLPHRACPPQGRRLRRPRVGGRGRGARARGPGRPTRRPVGACTGGARRRRPRRDGGTVGPVIRLAGRSIPDALVLSPMVDVTDAAFRSIAREWGADVTCSEMVSAAGLLHGNAASWRHVAPWPGETPYGIQFMTGDADEMAAAVRAVGERLSPQFIDINLGCPAPNILRSCAGGFLLKDPARAGRIMRAARAAADGVGIPDVSVKLRTGMDADHLTYLAVGEEAQAAGVAWATLHGRTVAQGYSGHADWGAIRCLVEHVDIPVVGNGDVRTPDDVVRMRDATGCAGFFIARAAMHDPTVFRRMRQALRGDPVEAPPSIEERRRVAALYVERAAAIGEDHPANLRRQVARFMAGAPGVKKMRVALHSADTVDGVRALLA